MQSTHNPCASSPTVDKTAISGISKLLFSASLPWQRRRCQTKLNLTYIPYKLPLTTPIAQLWKFASSAAYELGIGAEQPNGDKASKSKPKKKGKSKSKSLWPPCVSSQSDSCSWGGYDEPDASEFDVRGRNYLSDRVKRKSKASLFKLANVELYECEVAESYHIATHHKSWFRAHHKALPRDTFFLIYNMLLASLNSSIVATFVIKTNQPPLSQHDRKRMLLHDSKLVKDMLADLSSDDDDDAHPVNSPKQGF